MARNNLLLLLAAFAITAIASAQDDVPAVGRLFRESVEKHRLADEPAYSLRAIRGTVGDLEAGVTGTSAYQGFSEKERIQHLLDDLNESVKHLEVYYATREIRIGMSRKEAESLITPVKLNPVASGTGVTLLTAPIVTTITGSGDIVCYPWLRRVWICVHYDAQNRVSSEPELVRHEE